MNAWLQHAAKQLAENGIDSAIYDARELAQHALGVTRADLLTREITPSPLFWEWITARTKRIPLQHIIGTTEWGGLTLKTDSRALIPRPETEILLMMAVTEGQRFSRPRIVDVGTGSGAIGLALAHAIPDATVTLTDIAESSLALAQENAQQCKLAVTFHHGYLLEGLGIFDLVVANLPYLPMSDAADIQAEVKHDPPLALYSGEDGLSLARELVGSLAGHLADSGVALLELDPRNVRSFAAELQNDWHVTVFPDLLTRDRFLRIVRRHDID